jgi:hypothetical protein
VSSHRGTAVRHANVALLDQRTINHVNDSVGADDVRTEYVNLLVVPCYRVACKSQRRTELDVVEGAIPVEAKRRN